MRISAIVPKSAGDAFRTAPTRRRSGCRTGSDRKGRVGEAHATRNWGHLKVRFADGAKPDRP